MLTDVPRTRPSLLVRLKAPRDEHAWLEFVQIYEPLIARLARRQGLQEADADDLTQEVFARLPARSSTGTPIRPAARFAPGSSGSPAT